VKLERPHPANINISEKWLSFVVKSGRRKSFQLDQSSNDYPYHAMTAQLLVTELANLVHESKRKNNDLRQVWFWSSFTGPSK
jgi:hypothetical protein